MKVGLSQVGVDSPINYQRLITALIVFIIPATGTLIVQLPAEIMSSNTKLFLGLLVTYVLAILRGIGFVIGADTDNPTE